MTGWRLGCGCSTAAIDPPPCIWFSSNRAAARRHVRPGCGGQRLPFRSAGLRSAAMQREYAKRRDQVSDCPIGTWSITRGSSRIAQEAGFFTMLGCAAAWGLPSDEIRKRLLHEAGEVVVVQRQRPAWIQSRRGTLRVSFRQAAAKPAADGPRPPSAPRPQPLHGRMGFPARP